MNQRMMELQTYLDNMHIEVIGFQVEIIRNAYVIMVRFQDPMGQALKTFDMRFAFEDDLDLSMVMDPILAKIKFQKGQENNGTFEH